MSLRRSKHQTMPEQRAEIVRTLEIGTLFFELFTHDIIAQRRLLGANIKELKQKKILK